MRKLLKGILIAGIIVVVGGVTSIIAINMKPDPPVVEMDQARLALAAARNIKAETYARETFEQARLLYDSAMACWNRENSKFFLNRDFSGVIQMAKLSEQTSALAAELSLKSSSTIEATVKTKLKYLSKLVDEVNVLSRFPLSPRIMDRLAKGKLALSEGQAAFAQDMLVQSNLKVTEAETHLEVAHKEAYKVINNYFGHYNTWKSWKEQTIRESKQKKITSILVDKFAGKCYVYKNGQLTNEFDAELGKNWIGDKRQKGDRATPEGLYKVVDKKEGHRTKYYKALLINYPNDEDKKQFNAEIANGTLSKKSKIGGLIEIHGDGGKGTDWTDGCVALTNSDMDKIYKLVQNGTPVTIIGSAVSLDVILNDKKQ
ncbi:MAG: L,D-transpeptidase family protein [Bacteroidales bacterium]|nr:L,D-transpeptidase family protein [Bacteroidales bacterium]